MPAHLFLNIKLISDIAMHLSQSIAIRFVSLNKINQITRVQMYFL